MPQDKIDNIVSLILLLVGATSYNASQLLEIADKVVLFGFHLLSAISVSMIVVINHRKFWDEVRKFLKK